MSLMHAALSISLVGSLAMPLLAQRDVDGYTEADRQGNSATVGDRDDGNAVNPPASAAIDTRTGRNRLGEAALSRDEQEFIRRAVDAGHSEIELSQIAAARTWNTR